MKHFDDEATINQNIKRERKKEIEQRKGESKEKIKDKRIEKTLRNAGCYVMKSRLVSYKLLNYVHFTLWCSISTQSYFIHATFRVFRKKTSVSSDFDVCWTVHRCDN